MLGIVRVSFSISLRIRSELHFCTHKFRIHYGFADGEEEEGGSDRLFSGGFHRVKFVISCISNVLPRPHTQHSPHFIPKREEICVFHFRLRSAVIALIDSLRME